MMPKEKTANQSRQLKASGGSTPRLSLNIFCGFPPPPAMLVLIEFDMKDDGIQNRSSMLKVKVGG